GAEGVAFAEPKSAVAGLTEPRRVREDGFKYGLEVSWRTADDAENFGACRFSVERFAQLAGGRDLPLRSRLLLRHRFVELAGEQRDLLFVAGLGNLRGRGATRRLSRAAPLRFRAARSSSCHPIPQWAGRWRHLSI